MTLYLLSSVTRFGDDLTVEAHATVTRSCGSGADTGHGWVVEDLEVETLDGDAVELTGLEVDTLRDQFVEAANRS